MKDLIDRQIVAEYCRCFNAQDEEPYHGDIRNADAEDFLCAEIPRFECPDPVFEEIWYFRWWSFRKHIKSTPYGRVFLEFMPDVPWAGNFNTINCPAAHQLHEARWFNNKKIAEEYLAFWLNPETGAAVRSYTFGPARSALDLEYVTGNFRFAAQFYPALYENYLQWKQTHSGKNGLFFQTDNRDGMECSIGGSGYRATINSCMAAEAQVLAILAEANGDLNAADDFRKEYEELRNRFINHLWNEEMSFFMTRKKEDDTFVNVRELHGFTPWFYFADLPEKYDCAWTQLNDPEGFMAPFGPTTAERRHQGFLLDRSGHECQWNGPSWPFATSVTLTALEKLLHARKNNVVSNRNFFDVLSCYTRSHYLRENGKIIPWIDENLDPFTGRWLSREILKEWERQGLHTDAMHYERGKDYSHSTYADLIITGLCGIIPDVEGRIVVDPLLPAECWDYFLLDGVRLKGHTVSLQYDRDGRFYNRGRGLTLYLDGVAAANSENGLGRLEVQL